LEEIIGVIQGLKRGTMDTICDLFFTERRVIAAIVLHFSDWVDTHPKPDLITSLIGNLPWQREIKSRSLKLMDKRRLAFKNKTADEILRSHRANMEISREDIICVAIRRALLTTSLEFLVREPTERKISFLLHGSQIAEVERLLNRVLPNKVEARDSKYQSFLLRRLTG
jgi:hypothetical protein